MVRLIFGRMIGITAGRPHFWCNELRLLESTRFQSKTPKTSMLVLINGVRNALVAIADGTMTHAILTQYRILNQNSDEKSEIE